MARINPSNIDDLATLGSRIFGVFKRGKNTTVPGTALDIWKPATAAATTARSGLKKYFFGEAGRPWWKQARRAVVAGGLPVLTLGGINLMRGGNDAGTAEAELAGLGVMPLSSNDLRLKRLNEAYSTAENQVLAQEAALQKMLEGSAAADVNYQNLLQDYRRNTMRDIGGSYDKAAAEALRVAQQIEQGGSMAAQGITKEGAATAAALQALAEQPAQAGTGMFTGLVPVTGDVAEAPLAATNAADIAAQATQRGINITRDDLRAAAAMAPMVSEAYGRQVDSNTSMAMALAQIAGQKEREKMLYEETSRIGAQRTELALQKAAQEDELLANALASLAPEQLPITLGRYKNLMEQEGGPEALAKQGITSFAKYLEATLGKQTFKALQDAAGLAG